MLFSFISRMKVIITPGTVFLVGWGECRRVRPPILDKMGAGGGANFLIKSIFHSERQVPIQK